MKIVLIVVAVACFAIAGLYAAGVLQFGAHSLGPHFKHAAAFAILGVVALVGLRFQSSESGTAR